MKELLSAAAKHGCRVPVRRLRYWQSVGLVPQPIILPGKGHIGFYTQEALVRLVAVARSRRSHRELKKLDRRPTKEVVAVLDEGIPTVLEIVDYQTLEDGRVACILRDSSILIRSK